MPNELRLAIGLLEVVVIGLVGGFVLEAAHHAGGQLAAKILERLR